MVRLTDRLNMTMISVDWEVEPQTKQTNLNNKCI